MHELVVLLIHTQRKYCLFYLQLENWDPVLLERREKVTTCTTQSSNMTVHLGGLKAATPSTPSKASSEAMALLLG